MDFSLSEEQIAIRSRYREFAERELNGDLLEDDRECVFNREKWQRCAEFGLLGLAVPSEYEGGDGAGVATAMLAMEGLGHGCRDNGFAFAVNGQLCIRMPIVQLGSDEQKQKHLPPMCRGTSIGAFAFTEPDHGSDLSSLRTQAVETDGGYVLNGMKKLVTFAPIADFALVLATVDPKLGQWGLTAFLVDTDTPGLSVSPARDKMGLRTAPLGEVVLEDCFVSHDTILGSIGGGMSVLTASLEWERCCALASQVGAMERQVDDCVTYAQQRQQFGQSIGSFQSVANRIVDMKVRLETARLLLYRTAWLKDTGQSTMMDAAIAKLHLSECFVQSSLDAIRIHGGNGYMTETGVERDLRDSIGATLYGGTSDIQRNTIAKLLGL